MCGADPAALTCFLQCQVSLARFNGLSQFRLELFLQTLQMIPCQEENERLESGRKGTVLQMCLHTRLNRTGQFSPELIESLQKLLGHVGWTLNFSDNRTPLFDCLSADNKGAPAAGVPPGN